MLSFNLLVAAIMAGAVVAQSTTSSSTSPSSSGSSSSSDNTNFDVTQIDTSTRSGWCNDQLANCPKLCGGRLFTDQNSCIVDDKNKTTGATLSCTCKNGTAPGLAFYANTYATDQCAARFAACRIQNPGSDACIQCPTQKAEDVPASTSSAAATSTATSTSSASGSTTSPTGASKPKAPSSGGNVLVGAEMGVKGAVGLLAAMGFML